MPFTKPSALDLLTLNSPLRFPLTSRERSDSSAPPVPPLLTASLRPPPRHKRTMVSAIFSVPTASCATPRTGHHAHTAKSIKPANRIGRLPIPLRTKHHLLDY